MQSTFKRTIGALAAVAALVALAALATFLLPAPTAPVPPPAAAAPMPAPAIAAAPARVVVAAPGAALADQVDALVATRDPQQAYEAYRLLADCATFNRDGDRLIFDRDEATRHDGTLPGFRAMTDEEKRHDAVFCRGMTERMRQSRIDYLALAAQGGIPAAAIEQATVGPFGDRSALTTRPNDPLVREWKARVEEQLDHIAEQQADVGVISYLAAMRAVGNEAIDKDPGLAYRYGVAMGLIIGELNGADNALAKLYSPDSSLMLGTAASLPLAERAAQLAAAQRIAATARLRRQQAGASQF